MKKTFFLTLLFANLVRAEILGGLSPEEFGLIRNYECGDNCNFAVQEIYGKNDTLCFKKKNGHGVCFKINKCNFYGRIKSNTFIKKLKVSDSNQNNNKSQYALSGDSLSTGSIHSTCKMNGYIFGSFISVVPDSLIKDENPIPAISSESHSKDERLLFWNSYKKGYVGFLDFLKNIKNDDRLDGFSPKDKTVYNIREKGFTLINVINNKTYFATPNNMPSTTCNQMAKAFNLKVVSPNNKDLSFFLNDSNGKCVLYSDKKLGINKEKYAYKKIYIQGKPIYKCSPLSCVDGKCKTEKCPTGYEGSIFPGNTQPKENQCIDNICDGNKDFYPFCGRKKGCKQGPKYIGGPDDKICYELSCENGDEFFNPKTKKCKVKKCPPNTREVDDGTCRRF